MEKSSKHIWHFSKVGGVFRVNLENGKDLESLDQLDQKLWTALSCPVNNLEIDDKTLQLIDTDNDGKIRVPEILAATKWITSILKNPDLLLAESNQFELSNINEDTAEGKILLKSAKQILTNLGKPETTFLTVADTSDSIKIFANTKFNGDGIITPESAHNEYYKKLIEDIISTQGSVVDRTGIQGISTEIIDSFFKECFEYSEWYKKAEDNFQSVLPFGENTEQALMVFNQVKNKIDDFFLRCNLAAFDENSTAVLNTLIQRFENITTKDLTTCIEEIAEFPIAKIEAHKPLHLKSGINPAWLQAIKKFNDVIIKQSFSEKESLTEEEWHQISAKLDDYCIWKSEKKGESVEKIGLDKIREYLSDDKKTVLMDLIEQDKALENEANAIASVDKMVRFNRDIFTLLKNYVSFTDFYSKDKKAVFQVGTLYIDQRSCNLCIKVNDMTKQNAMSDLSGFYLLYCDCVSKINSEKMTIVAALTSGDIDNLMVGRNAIFYDRKGRDWDATITKIIDNPISIPQAFWSPYRKVSKMIGEQIKKIAASKDKQIESSISSGVEKTSSKVESATTKIGESKTVATGSETIPTKTDTAQKTTHQPFDIGKYVGIFAAIGLAVGAIGTAIAALLTGFMALAWWKMILAIVGLLLIISGPSMLLAWLKLRKRNLAPLLDANGWAINARAIVNIKFGKTLTALAKLPKNAKLTMKDPYSGKQTSVWIIWLGIIICIAVGIFVLYYFGFLQDWGILDFFQKTNNP